MEIYLNGVKIGRVQDPFVNGVAQALPTPCEQCRRNKFNKEVVQVAVDAEIVKQEPFYG